MSDASTRIALVTGTSSGIGTAVAVELLARGWRVVGLSRRRAPIESAAYTHVAVDLGDVATLADRLDEGSADSCRTAPSPGSVS